LYSTAKEVIIINCENNLKASTHTLEGVGIISINETCTRYATRDLLRGFDPAVFSTKINLYFVNCTDYPSYREKNTKTYLTSS